MARISKYDLRIIKEKILKDLYDKSCNKLKERRAVIAKLNREYLMKPLRSLIDQLPENLFSKTKIYQLFINYKPSDGGHILREIWQHETTDFEINPTIIQTYFYKRDPVKTNLNPKLHQVAMELCNDIIAFRDEESEMLKFLDSTMQQHSGTLGLKKVWPESLHKYLPVEFPLKKATKPKELNIAVPDFIHKRQTTNLLEGN